MSPGPGMWNTLVASFRITIFATLIATAVGIPIAVALSKRRIWGRSLWEGIVTLPLVMPPTALGYYLLVSLGNNSPPGRLYRALTGSGLVFSWTGVSLAVGIVCIPLLVRTLQVSLQSIDASVLDSARLDGASEVQIVQRIMLPLSWPGLCAGIGLAFARALGDFGVTLMVGGNIEGAGGTHTLSLAIYESINAGDDHEALALVLIVTAVCLIFSISASGLMRRHP